MTDTVNDAHVWNSMREHSKAKRARNRKFGAARLKRNGIDFESKNDGAHLIVKHNGYIADYWPGTGKWRIRGAVAYRRGITKLIQAISTQQKEN